MFISVLFMSEKIRSNVTVQLKGIVEIKHGTHLVE